MNDLKRDYPILKLANRAHRLSHTLTSRFWPNTVDAFKERRRILDELELTCKNACALGSELKITRGGASWAPTDKE